MSDLHVNAADAHDVILSGDAPDGLQISGHLDFTGDTNLGYLPTNLTVTRLTLNGCKNLRRLPAALSCYELEVHNSALEDLPPDIKVDYRLDLSDSKELRCLPDGLKTGSLNLSGCVRLEALPEGLDVYYLDISGCSGLSGWLHLGNIRFGRLTARRCSWLCALPHWITALAQLDVSGCVNLSDLPDGLTVSSWLDVTGTRIRQLPASLQGVRLRSRNVLVDQRIVFHPETISADEVLAESNAEVRRVMLDSMGYDAFLNKAQAEILDQDFDAGGQRQLLRVSLPRDEALVCMAVKCPSTGCRYMLRVPPATQSCRQAAAWIAGYDDPDDYAPLAET